ncbi:hypothetical protein H1R20_g12730, partial [Candolleomyces eurysporus]
MDWNHDRDRGYPYEMDRGPYDYRHGRSRSPPPNENRKRRRSMSPYERDCYELHPRHNNDYAPAPPPCSKTPEPSKMSNAQSKQTRTRFNSLDADILLGLSKKSKKVLSAAPTVRLTKSPAAPAQCVAPARPREPFSTARTSITPSGWIGTTTGTVAIRPRGTGGHTITGAGGVAACFQMKIGSAVDPYCPTSTRSRRYGGYSPQRRHAASGDNKPSGGSDDDMQFNFKANEEPADDSCPEKEQSSSKKQQQSSGNDRGEEISVPTEGNQVTIKTIPPDIGRVKLEELCAKIPGFVYLALDEVDMPAMLNELSEKKIEGFKLHVIHMMKPFVNGIRYTPEE